MIILLKSLVAGTVGLIAQASLAAELVGRIDKVVDGDTLWLCDQAACHKIRLCGIDAPELSDTKGQDAKRALEAVVDRRTVRCTAIGDGTICDGRSKRWSGDRLVAQCSVGKIDIGAALISSGHAREWVKFSGGQYGKVRGSTACRR